MNRISIECSVNGYRAAQMSGCWRLWIEIEDLAGRVVVQHELRARQIVRALIRFTERFVGRATTINDDARPGSHMLLALQQEQKY